MNCPKCGQPITKWRKRCEACGQDISVYARLVRLSNSFYNRGLERAKVRDLSGAVEMLKKSLEVNKENIAARNLLGLVYFEMGEAVAAISEWVISQNFSSQDNDAEHFLKKVQSDTAAFDTMNQTIKKYNIALENAKRKDDDLAIMQLKKVISSNPKFIRALLLLALIYLKHSEYEKAKRCLVRVQKIDVGNVTALRYLEEVKLHTPQGSQNFFDNPKEPEENPSSQIVPLGSYREEKPNFIAFITFFLGLLIGVAVIYFMAVPNIRKSIMTEYNQKENDYSSVLSAKDASISSLESDIRILEGKLAEMEKTLKKESAIYEPLLEQLYAYRQYLLLEEPSEEETETLFTAVTALDMSEITNTEAIALYEAMKEDLEARIGTES